MVVRPEAVVKQHNVYAQDVRRVVLPEVMQQLLMSSIPLISASISAFFEYADDNFFERADLADNTNDKNTYFDAMRELRLERSKIERQFIYDIENAFIRLVHPLEAPLSAPANTARDMGRELTGTPRRKIPRGANSGLNTVPLSHLAKEELEDMVVQENLIARANTQHVALLHQITLCMQALVDCDITGENNPIGPEVFCRAFLSRTHDLNIPSTAKIIFRKIFGQRFLSELTTVYINAIAVFTEHGITPMTLSCKTRVKKPLKGQHVLTENEKPANTQVTPKNTTFNGRFGQPLSHSPEVSAAIIVEALTTIQSVFPGVIPSHELLDLIDQTLGSKAAIRRKDFETINLVSLLFDFIMKDTQLRGPVKDVVSKLYVPVVKVALIDDDFFTEESHPARCLLNEISAAGVSWNPSYHPDHILGLSDPFLQKTHDLVDKIISDFKSNADIFLAVLQDFLVFVKSEKRDASILEKRTLDAEDGKAKSKMVHSLVNDEMTQRLAHSVLPFDISEFVQSSWRQVLVVVGLKYGEGSDALMAKLNVLSDLVWSLQPHTLAEERQQLIQMVPMLHQRIRKGLEVISYNPYEMTQFFNSLDALHLRRIRGECVEGIDDICIDNADIDNTDIDNVVTEETELYSSSSPDASCVSESESPSDIGGHELAYHLGKVSEFSRGAWFEIHEEGCAVRCRLAAVIKYTGKYVFVDRHGAKVAEKSAEQLADMLMCNRLSAIDNGLLFDRALEKVVTGLRRDHQV